MIGIGFDDGAGEWVDAIYIAAVAPIPRAHASPQLTLDKRAARCSAQLLTHAAAVCGGDLGVTQEAGRGSACLVRNESDCATLRATAEKYSLRSAQHLNAR